MSTQAEGPAPQRRARCERRRSSETSYDTIIPAAACLAATWVNPSRTHADEIITAHFPVFGLRGEGLTLVIELHGRPATSADLDSWLIGSGDRGTIYPSAYGDGNLWRWDPACECRGETVEREPSVPEYAGDYRDGWAEWKARSEAARRGGAPVPPAG